MSSNPMRVKSGFTQDAPFQPLSLIGKPDPFFYTEMHDDFTSYIPTRYIITATGNGSVTGTDSEGGAVTITTNSTTPAVGDLVGMQADVAHMKLDATKKMAFLCRIQLADATNPALNVGKIQRTATPFTVTNGIYFNKPSGSTVPTLNVVSGSVVQATKSLAGLVAFANNTYLDLGWQYDGRHTLLIYAGSNLVGWNDQNRVSPAGPVASLDLTGIALSATLLAVTAAVQSGTASSKTALMDFILGCKER